MKEQLNKVVEAASAAEASLLAGGLSEGERCYVALASGCYELLPISFEDPLEAWHRLDGYWQSAVCKARGWPLSWAASNPPY